MRRFWFLVSLLFASFAFAQTYVRPSKGTAFNPFASSTDFTGTWTGYPTLTGEMEVTSRVYDWTAFTGVSVYIYPEEQLAGCPEPLEFTAAQVGNYIRFKFQANKTRTFAGETIKPMLVSIEEGPTPSGPFKLNQGQSVAFPVYTVVTCNSPLRWSVTPIPFSPSGNAAQSSVNPDLSTLSIPAGSVGSYVWRNQYTWTLEKTQGGVQFLSVASGGAVSPALTSPLYTLQDGSKVTVRVCNSKLNAFGYVQCLVTPMDSPSGGAAYETLLTGECLSVYADNTQASVYLLPYTEPDIGCIGNPGTQVVIDVAYQKFTPFR